LATLSLPSLCSIPLALSGMGYWALVFGSLFGQLAQAIMLWSLSSWRPTWTFSVRVASDMGRFGAWVAASGLLAWFYAWADSLIVGMYLGNHELGLYSTGNQFVLLIYGTLSGPLLPVLYSHYSRMTDPALLVRHIEISVHSLAIIFIPLSMLLFAVSDLISSVIFGEKWVGIATVISIMALSHGISYIFQLNGEIYRAAGKPNYETIPMLIGVAVFLPAYLLSISYGLEAFLLTRLTIVTIFGTTLHSILARKSVGVSPWLFMKYVIVFALLASTLISSFYIDEIGFNAQLMACLFSLGFFIFSYTLHRHKIADLLINSSTHGQS
jgi:O-antigen/teichoic acid export membrane protein